MILHLLYSFPYIHKWYWSFVIFISFSNMFWIMKLKYYLHSSGADWHACVLHVSVLEDEPWQLLPPFWACCRIVLVAFLCPEPQVLEHLPHEDQFDHWQSTMMKNETKSISKIYKSIQAIETIVMISILLTLIWSWYVWFYLNSI